MDPAFLLLAAGNFDFELTHLRALIQAKVFGVTKIKIESTLAVGAQQDSTAVVWGQNRFHNELSILEGGIRT